MNPAQHILLLLFAVVAFFAQMLTGSDVPVALLFTAGMVCGVYAVAAAGGLRSPAGMLNALLIGKFLLVALVIKCLNQEAVDENLLAPVTTAAVMAIGFAGLLAGTWLYRLLPVAGRLKLIPEVADPQMYCALAIVFLVFGYGGYLAALGPELSGKDLETGGWIGVARAMSAFKSFAIVPALFFAWMRGGRFMTHPMVLVILAIQVAGGAFTTGKLDAMEPLAFYFLVGVLRYGLRDKRLWALAAGAFAYYALVIYPYSQYVRINGGREGSASERFNAMTSVLWQIVTDPEFRQMVTAEIDRPGTAYLGDRMQAYSRFAMVGEADRLIAATAEQQAYTGWETIVWGFHQMMPSFLFPDKPIWGTGNYLAHIAGDVNSTDNTTQVAYGVMANLYNAFALPGVLLGSIAFFAFFYYFLRVCFGDPVWTQSPVGGTIWYLLIVAAFGHSLVEQSMAGLIAGLPPAVVVVAIFCAAARLCAPFMPGTETLR